MYFLKILSIQKYIVRFVNKIFDLINKKFQKFVSKNINLEACKTIRTSIPNFRHIFLPLNTPSSKNISVT